MNPAPLSDICFVGHERVAACNEAFRAVQTCLHMCESAYVCVCVCERERLGFKFKKMQIGRNIASGLRQVCMTNFIISEVILCLRHSEGVTKQYHPLI